MTFVEVAKTTGIAPGTMKHVETGGKELCVINAGGTFYVIGDRCPHMNARLSMGTLQGNVLTCAYHFSRFDIKTGKKLSGPVEAKVEGADKLPPPVLAYMKHVAEIMAPIKTYDLQVYPARVEGTSVLADI